MKLHSPCASVSVSRIIPFNKARALSFQCLDLASASSTISACVIDATSSAIVQLSGSSSAIALKQALRSLDCPKGIEDMNLMPERAAEARRPCQFAFRVEYEHRARIEVKIGLQNCRRLAGPRARNGDQRPVIEVAKKPPGELAENDLARRIDVTQQLVRGHPEIDRSSVRRNPRDQHAARQRRLKQPATAAIKRRQSEIGVGIRKRGGRRPLLTLRRSEPAHPPCPSGRIAGTTNIATPSRQRHANVVERLILAAVQNS